MMDQGLSIQGYGFGFSVEGLRFSSKFLFRLTA